MRGSGGRGWSVSGRRVLWAVGGAWMLTLAVGVVHVCRMAHVSGWLTSVVVVLAVVLCALLAAVVLAVDPSERERHDEPPPR